MFAFTAEKAVERALLKLPLVNPKASATRRATNAMIAPYSVIPCPFLFRPRLRERAFTIAIVCLRYNDKPGRSRPGINFKLAAGSVGVVAIYVPRTICC